MLIGRSRVRPAAAAADASEDRAATQTRRCSEETERCTTSTITLQLINR